MKIITSKQNQIIKNICALHYADVRYAQKLFIAEGERTIATLLNYGVKVEQLFCTEKLLNNIQNLIDAKHITIVSDDVMQKISQATTPSGILAIFHMPEQPNLNQLSSGIILAQLQDPGNVGTLIRSCAAMGFKSVVMVDSVDPWSYKVVQSSAGVLGAVTIFKTSWHELIEKKPKDLLLCALVVQQGKKPTELNLNSCLLVVGNEAQGLPEFWINQCQIRMTIPMPGNTESLNAAVAGSLALYIMAMHIDANK